MKYPRRRNVARNPPLYAVGSNWRESAEKNGRGEDGDELHGEYGMTGVNPNISIALRRQIFKTVC
jgi:hypothetical protein